MTAFAARPGEDQRSGPSPHWSVTFSVNGTDTVVERAVQLGGNVLSPPTDRGGGVVRTATLQDPQGAIVHRGELRPDQDLGRLSRTHAADHARRRTVTVARTHRHWRTLDALAQMI